MMSKLPHTSASIFSVMSALAKKESAINLSQGFPDFEIDQALCHYLNEASNKKENHQYAPMAGDQELRDILISQANLSYNLDWNLEDNIVVTAGATQALFTAITAMVHPGNEVIIFSPAYDSYAPAVQVCGGVCKHVSLSYPNFRIDWKEVAELITDLTKLIIINFPHNPTGALFNKNDLAALSKLAIQHDLLVLSDEVYTDMVFDGREHCSVLEDKELRKRSLVTYSFGKKLHITGWKMGYCIGSEVLMEEFKKVHQFNVFSCNHLAQKAIAKYLKNNYQPEEIRIFYQKKRDLFLDKIKDSRFSFDPTKSTYFQLLKYDQISSALDVELAKEFTIKNKIASIPISVFNHNKKDEKLLRFCFAKTDETLEEAAYLLCKI